MDETVFSSNQVKPKIWYVPQSGPIFMKKQKVGFQAIAVAGAIDRSGKLVAYHLQDRSIDSDAFCVFLEKLKVSIGRKKAVLLLDNLGIHRTKKAKDLARRLQI